VIDRRAFLAGTGAVLLAAPLAADAQPAMKVPRIGLLWGSSPSAGGSYLDAFRQGLRELGYVEGQNIVIENRWAEGRQERFTDLAAELVRLKVDVIVAAISAAALAAKNATTTIPVVMLVVGDPVRFGFVASLARPGGNITGLTSVGDELFPKQLELLKEAVPRVSRVAVLWNPANPSHGPSLKSIEVAARSLGMQPQLQKARGPDEFDSAFAAMTRARAGALLVLADTMFNLHRTRIADLAVKARLPAMYGLREHVEAGGLVAYAANYADLCRRGATYVDKILKGAKPADLPVEQPTKFELVINLKTAKALGLTIPPSVLEMSRPLLNLRTE
jgi:putative ABC transport system substrate-binding protein